MSFQACDLCIGWARSAVARLARLAVRQRADDAIVILQNIHRHFEGGLSPIQAALTARHEGTDDPGVYQARSKAGRHSGDII